MNTENSNPRIALFREAATLQLKLLADGIRDALLIPISIIAAIVGLLRGGEDCDREYRRVITLGRRSERWINLFGHQPPLGVEHPAGSMDKILNQVEAIVMDQYRKGKSGEETRAAVRDALKTQARGEERLGKDGPQGETPEPGAPGRDQ
ncbi:MAG: hypothetical protein KJO33_01285 [Gammaproteobacteria bacterium]|nr:hypothetical protein [Gammaproteobacteria bacterium]